MNEALIHLLETSIELNREMIRRYDKMLEQARYVNQKLQTMNDTLNQINSKTSSLR